MEIESNPTTSRGEQPFSTENEGETSQNSDKVRKYAGLDADHIAVYNEQSLDHETIPVKSSEVYEVLAEDINYKLRFIIHEALLKARLRGRNGITYKDLNETFDELQIERVYGAPCNPNWVPFGDRRLLLDDLKIDLIELAEKDLEVTYCPKTFAKRCCYPQSANLQEHFSKTFSELCMELVAVNDDARRRSLRRITQDSTLEPIVDWFYCFSYQIMSQEKVNSLILPAIELIESFENSPLGNLNVSCNILHLIVELILQRLILGGVPKEANFAMHNLLALLCLRQPLRELVINKLNELLLDHNNGFNLLLVMKVVLFLGFEAVQRVFYPNVIVFMTNLWEYLEFRSLSLGIYLLVCRADPENFFAHKVFEICFPTESIMCIRPQVNTFKGEKEDMDLVNVRKQLILKRYKIPELQANKKRKKLSLDQWFELPKYNCEIKRKLEQFNYNYLQLMRVKKDNTVTVGKATLLLSFLKPSFLVNTFKGVSDYTLCAYNLLYVQEYGSTPSKDFQDIAQDVAVRKDSSTRLDDERGFCGFLKCFNFLN